MPRPIIFDNQKNNQLLSVENSIRKNMSPMELDRKLRQKRSSKYIQQMTKLDAGDHIANKGILQALIDIIKEELPEVTIDALPTGIVAKCYLDPPYEVHCLDITGNIIKHYKTFESLPPELERARSLAVHGGYAFIEVYRDCLRAIKDDGSVSVVKEG